MADASARDIQRRLECWMNWISGPLVLITLVIVVVLLAAAGLVLVRRKVSRDLLSRHADVAGYVYAVVGVLYGVILAQVVVAAWEKYQDAENVAAVEASALLNLDRLARTWPAEQREGVRTALIDYATNVVEVEWPAMRAGDFSFMTQPGLTSQLWSAYDEIAESESGTTANYSASLDQLDALGNARRGRFLLGEISLPQTMTLTLVLGAIITVGFSYLFAVENGWIHFLMTASLAILTALLLSLTYQLQTPYEGIDAIEPTAMQLVLDDLKAGGR
jgi:hypothetical protein